MNYDIIVIGSGPGGYVAAIKAAKMGKKTALVERAELGGVCLNWGCIPTKAMLKSAQVFGYVRSAATYGVDVAGEVTPSLEKIVARSRNVAATMSKGVQFLLGKSGVEVISGHGRLTAERGVVEVLSAEGEVVQTISADHIILATGSRPRELPSLPVDGKYIINSRQALTLDKLPQSMVVVGSGAIGCEFAYLYAALGVKVTVVEFMPKMLPLSDDEVSKTLERSFRKMRATVLTSTSVKSVKIEDEKCLVEIEGKKGAEIITADIVLSAVGIKSNIENLGLEAAGVEVERDKVKVDENFRTTAEGVYAIGDLVASPALAHVATAEALACVEAICTGEARKVDYSTIPSCVYTVPEVAMVGLTEEQATAEGYSLRIGRFPYTASGKATAAGDRDGFVKLIFDAESDKLLGAHLIGGNVTEMLGEVTIAREWGITREQIAHTIHPHPTMNEAILEAAEAATGDSVHV
ncbi:MAG: dihydrolipoyl dehydrogenase [Tidjanibacter sp.]|nr:dihydrolipoyl dehydrogenase [Tidjanibacter sp.]